MRETAVVEHEFLAPGADVRCVHCGTKQGHHRMVSQPCVPRWSEAEGPMPEPARRVYASEDFDTIHARCVELETDTRAGLNVVHAEEEGGVQH